MKKNALDHLIIDRSICKLTQKTLAALLILTVISFAIPQAESQENQKNNGAETLFAYADDLEDLGDLIFTRSDRALWQAAIGENEISQYDKRLTNLLLPRLAALFGDLKIQTLYGYKEENNKISREFSGATNLSQRAIGKAAAVTAIGTVSCGTETLFARVINPPKPLWLHYQKKQENKQGLNDFFGRSFDKAARESFWLEGRAFTNALITPKSWSDFLQRVAKAEIEEQFGLKAGSLGLAPSGEMESTLGRLRLASQLGLPDLPLAGAENELYADLGQWQIENSLALPRYSLRGETWRDIYQNIGFRVLEDQFSPSSQDLRSSPFNEGNVTENPRFQLLAQQLEKRAKQYANPRRALNLPTESYLPQANDQLGLLDKLLLGDPDAFATAGAYHLADSLQLNPAATELFIKSIAGGDERVPNLSSAHPLDNSLPLTDLFSSETTAEKRLALFEQAGKSYELIIKENLEAVNEIVLLSLVGDNKNPSLSQVIAAVTDENRRPELFIAIGRASAEEADYSDGFSAKTLQERAINTLGKAFNLEPADITALAQPERNESDPALKATGNTIDRLMNWPEGTAMTIARQELNDDSAAASLYEQQRLRQGATKLWGYFGFSDSLADTMNNLYFSDIVPSDEELAKGLKKDADNGSPVPEPPSETNSGPEANPSPGNNPDGINVGTGVVTTSPPGTKTTDGSNADKNEGDTDLGFDEDEVVQFAIAPQELSLAGGLQAATLAPLSSIDALLAGRLRAALTQATLASLARQLGEDSTITVGKLIELYEQPTHELATAVAQQAESTSGSYLVDENFFSSLKENVASQFYPVWNTLTNEAIRQWNIDCPSLLPQAETTIASFIEAASEFPAIGEVENQEENVARPAQIITYSKDYFNEPLVNRLTAAYPGMGERGIKWGLYTSPRAWDHLLLVN